MKPLRILQIVSGRGVNGAVLYCKLLSERLSSRGHHVSVLHRPSSWIDKRLVDGPVGLISSSLKRFPTGELQRIAAFVRKNNIDVIHTHMSSGHTFGVLLKMMSGVPAVATAHSRNFQLHWRLNDYVIANSDATRDYHRRVNFVPGSRMHTVHCFPDLDRFKKVRHRQIVMANRRLRLTGDEFLVGVVGEVVPRKGHIHLFRALSKIVKAVPNFKLVVVGRFNRKEPCARALRNLLLDENLIGRVKWLGVRQNVEDYMKIFDLTVVPSIEEPLGLVAIESLASETPVVATNVGGLPEIVRDEETGILVPPRNPDAIANAVIRMAKDDRLRKQWGKNGRTRMFRQFDAERLTRDVESVYYQILSKRRAA